MFFRRDTRGPLPLSSLFSFLSPLSSFFGYTFTRRQILRLSSLLALRTLLSALSLPLDSAVLSYVWTFLFASIQASVALAAAASFLNLGGLLSLVAERLFARPFDAPFVKFYSTGVLLIAPLVSLAEAVVITFEAMRVSRWATDRMFESEAKGHGPIYRRLILLASLFCALATASLIFLVSRVYPGNMPILMGTIVIALYSIVVFVEAANVLECSIIALHCCVTLVVGLIEEFDAPTLSLDWFLIKKGTGYPKAYLEVFGGKWKLGSDEVKAAVLVYTVVVLLFAMSKAPRFVKLVELGYDELRQEEGQTRTPEEGQGERGGFLNGPVKQLYNTVVLMAVTFRFLIWTGEVDNSEYMPLLVRGVQVVAMMVCYRGFLGKEPEPEQQPEPEPLRDIAGNIIENTYR